MSGRVVCINPPSSPGTTANREGAGGMGNAYPQVGAFLYPPHTLAAAAGALRAGGLDVSARDCVLEGVGLDQAVAWVATRRPDMVAVQVSWATRDADAAFLRGLREAVSGAAVVAVGASVPVVEDALRDIPGIAWLCGEPERLLAAAVATLDVDSSRWAGRLSSSALRVAGFANDEHMDSLEGLPHPAWDLFPWRRYGMLTVVASKGCNHRCAYCPYVVAQGRQFRPRPVADVVDELRWLAATFGRPRVVFRDPVFALDRGRVLALCEEVVRANLRLSWECESRVDDLDEEMVAAMAKAGCTTVKLGVETASRDLLVAVGRVPDGTAAETYTRRALEAAELCRKHGVACRVFALTGLPGETDDAVEETIRLVREMRPAALHVKECTWYPGTGLPPLTIAEEAQAQERARRLSEACQPAPPPKRSGLLRRLKRRLAR